MKNTKWNSFLTELSKLYFFWFFGILFFFIYRIVFLLIFHNQISKSTNFLEYFKVVTLGLKFDGTVVSYFIIIPLLILLLFSYFNLFRFIKISRILFQYLFVFLSSTIIIITINYFIEYNDQFNNFLFLALYDDQKAVLKTAIKEFHPFINLIAFLFTVISSILILRYFENKRFIYKLLDKLKINKIILIFLTLSVFFITLRGSITKRPVMRKWAAISNDQFLNKTVLNPYRAFMYALKDFKHLNLLDGKNKFLNKEHFNKTYSKPLVTDYLKKKASGATINKPKQLFIIVMESYDSWPLMDKYLPFKLSTNLSNFAKNGMRFSSFIPASNSTFNSFGAIVTGVPYVGINISHLGKITPPFKTSLFKQFKNLGYTSNMYYGGFLSWQNIGEFSHYQGADNLFSGVDCGGKSDSGDWGVEDEKIFNLVIKNTKQDEYSVNVILTSSYHAPYTIDLDKKGFPYHSKEDLPESMKKYYDEGMSIKQMGHLWYGDKAIGDFVKEASKKFPEAIFCFTGDHFGRRFLNFQPNLYERSSVNFIIYGNGIPKINSKTPGTHIDIIPTLIEMIAPKDFEYYSFGSSLLNPNKTIGISHDKLIIPNELYYFRKDDRVDKITLNNMHESIIDSTNLKHKFNKQMALAWYYTMKGDSLKTN